MLFVSFRLDAADCPSNATINISSSGYSGSFNVELRAGSRPGSRVERTTTMSNQGRHTFYGICRGNYFFSFGTPDSDQVNVTGYFNVQNDGYSYSNPEVTVYYSRSSGGGSQVRKMTRSNL